MIEWVLAWASDHRDQALWLIPALAFMETCVGIGLFVPSLLLVIVCSVLYANDAANLRAINPSAKNNIATITAHSTE